MTEPPKIRKRILLVGPMILAGLVLSGCLGRPAAPRGAATAESSKARAADRVATLPSGATLNVAADRTVTGGAWSSVKDYARYVRLELAKGRLPDGSTVVTEKNLLARRAAQVRTGERSWYGMGLLIENIKDVPVISHGGSMFGYKSNFFFVPDAGVGGVMLTNADSGERVTQAFMRRTLEVLYDGKPEAEEELLSGVRETRIFLEGQQRRWAVPADPAEVQRLASSYRNAALGGITVRKDADGVVFEFGGWKSRMASKANPDGSMSFISIDPGVRGFEFNARAASGVYTRLRLGDPQHSYIFESRGE